MNDQNSSKDRGRAKAKILRKKMTEAERIVWRILRAKRLSGYKFRRQHPIEHFIVDFASCSHRVIIEIDGPYHEGQQNYDCSRTQFFQKKGFTILRFTNDDVYERPERVKSLILSAIEQTL